VICPHCAEAFAKAGITSHEQTCPERNQGNAEGQGKKEEIVQTASRKSGRTKKGKKEEIVQTASRKSGRTKKQVNQNLREDDS